MRAMHTRALRFANDLDVSPSTGVVYFTDSGAVPPPHSWDGPGHEPFVDAVKGFLGTFCHVRTATSGASGAGRPARP